MSYATKTPIHLPHRADRRYSTLQLSSSVNCRKGYYDSTYSKFGFVWCLAPSLQASKAVDQATFYSGKTTFNVRFPGIL